jgi:hypothetical protein
MSFQGIAYSKERSKTKKAMNAEKSIHINYQNKRTGSWYRKPEIVSPGQQRRYPQMGGAIRG